MKIAVNYENGTIFQHFGMTRMFKIYEIENGSIVKSSLLPADGAGHGALPVQLKENDVTLVICGGLGMGMMNALQANGIEVCANVSGDADEAVRAYLSGTLQYDQEAHACHGHHH